ncbi:MAG TPA: hypothetical protein VLA49_03985 [Anaerolineales bacterium]|nr:hypothetical protein [Anaerolineales bacterium]
MIAPMRVLSTLRKTVFVFILAALLGGSTLPPTEQTEKVRAFTRDVEFDYVSWTLDALMIKFQQVALGSAHYLPESKRHQIVLDHLSLIAEIQQTTNRLNDIFADPNITDPQRASQEVRADLEELIARRVRLAPLAESILQDQTAIIVAEMDIALGGQPIPPVLYHSTPLPLALIVSPRKVIRQDENISLLGDLSVDQQVTLEDQVDAALDVSSLVVGIGGVGVYPTMVMQTTDLNWLTEVIAHEWVHNFLSLRPLGINYLSSPELRTINETTASIAGKEIGRALIERYYPELLPPPPQQQPDVSPQPASPQPAPQPPVFDFRAEMRQTRLTVDALLAEGQIEEAEAYMEARRALFWENGYHLRKINQAYFAFYGAYADQPGGAAGEDPVGAAVRAFRSQSPDLATFLKQISWMTSFEQLQGAVNPEQ